MNRLTRGTRLLPILAIVLTAGCISYQPVSQLEPPAGPDPDALAGGFSVQNVLGVDDSEHWPEAGERAALVSCAVAFRPEEEADLGSLSYLTGALDVAESDLEAIVETFCSAFVEYTYSMVPLDWLPESRIREDVLPQSDDAAREMALAHEGYAYFGSVGGGVVPTLKGGMRDLGRELDATVFIAGITLKVADEGQLQFTGGDLVIQGYDPAASRMKGLADLQIVGSGHYILDDYGSDGLRVLAEALAIRFAHVIETQTGDWPDDG